MVKHLSAPLNICLSVTGKCNLRCRHCYVRDFWDNEGLSSREMTGLIDQIGGAKVVDVLLYGGEPLLRKDIFRVIERLKSYPLKVSMSTNATLISRAVSRELRRSGVKEFVVSLDGLKQNHERTRGTGSFDATVSGIRNLVRDGGRVVVSFTVSRINRADLEKTAALGKKLGAAMIKYNRLNFMGNAASHFDELYVSPAQELEVCSRVLALAEKYPGFIGGTYKVLTGKLEEKGPAAKTRLRIPACGAAIDRCAIRPDGRMIPCEVTWDATSEGTVQEEGLLALWKNSSIMKEFRRPLEVDLRKAPECSGCGKQSACYWGRCFPYFYRGQFEDRRLFCLNN
ncbi:MAG: radical SAM protein [Endomicrobiales bacterium]